MNRHYFFWIALIAFLSLIFTFFTMWQDIQPPIPPVVEQKLQPHPQSPFSTYISGVGIVEPSSDNISIGTPINRIIEKVWVQVGVTVKKGDVLFQLEDQDLKADLANRQASYQIAQAKLKKLEALPRQEDVVAAEADFKTTQIAFNQAKDDYERVQGLQDSRALSQQEIQRRSFNYEQAEAKWQQAQAQLNKVKSGTWRPDLDIAQLEVQQAKVSIERAQAEIQRTFIRSPLDGKVLQVRIHEGEYPAVMSFQGPLMIIGNTDEMYLKVSINQFDTSHFRPDAPAVAFFRGNTRISFPLEFVRLEPFLVNKHNLTNEITEKVDTRVLQVIYRIKKEDQLIFVGQQMDVFIKADFPL